MTTTLPKRRGPLFWVSTAIVSMVVLFVVAVGIVGYFGSRLLIDQGLTKEVMQRYPDFARHKVTVLLNKDLEIVSEDKEANKIMVRSKKSGQVFEHSEGESMRLLPGTPSTVK